VRCKQRRKGSLFENFSSKLVEAKQLTEFEFCCTDNDDEVRVGRPLSTAAKEQNIWNECSTTIPRTNCTDASIGSLAACLVVVNIRRRCMSLYFLSISRQTTLLVLASIFELVAIE
jgi:hypothetical protein